MRVLYVIEFEHRTGGLVRTIEQLIRYIVPLNVQCGVLLPRSGPAEEVFKEAGAVTFVGQHRWTVSVRRPLATALTFCRVARRFREVVDEFRPDLVHTNHLTAEVLTAAACRRGKIRIPRVFTQQGNVYWYRGGSRQFLKRALRTIDQAAFISPHGLDDAERLIGVPRSKLRVIPNATDLHLLPPSPCDLRQEWGVAADEFLSGVVAYIAPGKLQETLLEAGAILREKLPRARYAIIGPPSGQAGRAYEARLRQMVRDLGLEGRVLFTGYIPDQRAIMDALDVLVSTSEHEGFGQTIIEGWACRKPVVAAEAGGPEYTITHGVSGFVFKPRDSHALAEYLLQLSDRQVHARMGQAGFQRVLEEYDSRVMSQRFKDFYQQVLEHRNGE